MSIIELLVQFLPVQKKVKVRSGISLLHAARQANVAIVTRCGGNSSCLMCKVHIKDQTGVSAPNKSEILKLGPLIENGTRLACQTKVIDSVTVELPPDRLRAAIEKQLMRQQEEDKLW